MYGFLIPKFARSLGSKLIENKLYGQIPENIGNLHDMQTL
jgi:hypothetical protein